MFLFKETMKLLYKFGLIFLVVFIIVKGCNTNESNARLNYYKDNPNTNKTYEQEVEEGKIVNDLIEESKRNK